MVRCDRCDGYVSRDYARVFGDNRDRVTSCPNCQTGRAAGEEPSEERSEQKLTFKMSEFDADEQTPSNDDSDASEASGAGGRFGRVGAAVSGLF